MICLLYSCRQVEQELVSDEYNHQLQLRQAKPVVEGEREDKQQLKEKKKKRDQRKQQELQQQRQAHQQVFHRFGL